MDHEFVLDRPDGARLQAYRWTSAAAPRAAMIVSHGMGEHALRYRPALAKLIDSGVAIYALDQRGHGATMALSGRPAGDFGPGGFAAVVDDLAALADRARSEHPGLPLFLLGHSMGSFISQAFLIEHARRIDAAILVGTADVAGLAQSMANEADTMAALNRPFEPARTPFDWLSRDEAQVDAYIADPLCGFSLVPDSAVQLMSQGEKLADASQLARIPSELPLYILVGDRDVLISHLSRLDALVERYRAAGLRPVVAKYAGARHEVLNETNRAEVVSELLAWIDQTIGALRA